MGKFMQRWRTTLGIAALRWKRRLFSSMLGLFRSNSLRAEAASAGTESDKGTATPSDKNKSHAHEFDLLAGSGQRALEDDDTDRALECLKSAVYLDPTHGIALGLLGVAAARSGDTLLLAQTIEQVCHLQREELRNALRVGTWFSDTHRLGEQFAVRKSANWHAFSRFASGLLDQIATDNESIFFFAQAVYHLRLLSLSHSALSRYLAGNPDDPEALGMLIDTQLSLCDLSSYDDFVAALRNRVQRDLESGHDCKIDPYNLLGIGIDYGIYAKVCALRSARIIADQHASTSSIKLPRGIEPTTRIRVGFLLPYSWFSSLNMVLAPLLPHFDRSRFEICAYAMQSAPEPDEFEVAFRGRFDSCCDLPKNDPKAAADRIRADGIDILLETSGHTRVNCLSIAAHRPAPVQAHYLGYSNAISAPFIDYLIADNALIPFELQSVCTDSFALMPKSVATYPKAPIASDPKTRRDLDLPDDAFCYCSFNHLSKIEPKIFSAWLEILRRVPESLLVLCHWNLAESVENLRDVAKAQGVDPERLRFVSPCSHDTHLRRLQLMNLALDTYYMGGGVTTLDALWSGLPLLSVSPDRPTPHNGADMLGAVEIPELIVPNLDRYVSEAVKLAGEPARLNEYKRKLDIARETSILFDHRRYVRQFERILETMWGIHISGGEAASFCAVDYV